MATAKTTTFKSGNSEAVRLPKDIGFGVGVELEAVRTGDVVTLRPAGQDNFRMMIEALSAMPKPSKLMKRPRVIIPKRRGL